MCSENVFLVCFTPDLFCTQYGQSLIKHPPPHILIPSLTSLKDFPAMMIKFSISLMYVVFILT